MKKSVNILLFSLLLSNLLFSQKLILGNENFLENYFEKIKNKNLALVINKASKTSNGTFLLDTLLSLDARIKKIFTLEHGLKLSNFAGEKVENSVINNIPIISLYGKKKAPDTNDLKNIDYIIYDIQDVGVRFYTYISSLKLILKSAAQNKIPILILDRPNPQMGKIEGELLLNKYKSFVGISEIPIIYGMTCGELALFFSNEIKEKTGNKVNLEIIKMKNYKRNKNYFSEEKLKWTSTSPNINSLNAALLYPGLCFLEATNISEGRGTNFPFEQFGSPFINPKKIINELNLTDFKNMLKYVEINFLPENKSGNKPKYSGEKCFGIKISIIDNNFNSVLFGIILLKTIKKIYPRKLKIDYNWLGKLYGNKHLEEYLTEKLSLEKLKEYLSKDRLKFNDTRSKFLLY